MRFVRFRFCAISASVFCILWFWLAEVAIATPDNACEGTVFRGAWFTAVAPSGMEIIASRVAPAEGVALSAWLRSEDASTEFYIFAPQWGGTPYDIFLGAESKREMVVIDSQSLRFDQLELIYDDKVGRYSITQSSDPVSHLTVGYRTRTGTLTEDFLRKYDCFVNSINQYSD